MSTQQQILIKSCEECKDIEPCINKDGKWICLSCDISLELAKMGFIRY